MNAEPGAAQCGHQVMDFHRLQCRIGHHQQGCRHGGNRKPVAFQARPHHNQHQGHTPGESVGKLKLIAERQAFGCDAARYDEHRVHRKSCQENIPGCLQKLLFLKRRSRKLQDDSHAVKCKRRKEQSFHVVSSPFVRSYARNSSPSSIRMRSGFGPPTA